MAKLKFDYKHTIFGCFVSYIIQAVVNNYVPLLFVTFMNDYSLSLDKISIIIIVNFSVQLFIDLMSTPVVKVFGYRGSVLLAHLFSAVGLLSLAFLPDLIGNAFVGMIIGVVIYAIGGGLIEVVISPMVEACPTKNKQATMSLLHSFFCWGTVAVVLLSTIFFSLFGTQNWKILTALWAILPVVNGVFMIFVPINTLNEDEGTGMPISKVFKKKIFWVMLAMMTCAGASEIAISQWASTFAETGLGVSKSIGDLAGPMLFALLMGTSRLVYAKWGVKLQLERYMLMCAVLCVVGYLTAALSPQPTVGFVGCALSGLSVGVMWPGTYNLAMKYIPNGKLSMFSFLALAGDLGCTCGPTVIGFVSGAYNNNLNIGIGISSMFPFLMIVISTMLCIKLRKWRA